MASRRRGLPEDVSEPRRAGSPRCLRSCAAGSPRARRPSEVLWAVWSASRWRERAGRDGAPSGQRQSPALLRHADRQLDAVVALFDAAARFTDRLPAAGLEVFLEGLAAAGDSGGSLEPARIRCAGGCRPAADRPPLQGAGVGPRRRRRGAGGVWPDLRRRSTLLEADALASAEEEPTLFADDEAAAAARAERAGRGAAAVLRRDHPGPPSAAGHGGQRRR